MHTNQACNLLCYEVISNCIPCLKVKTCCLVFYHALTLYELDVHWMKSFFVSLSAQHRVSGLKLRIKEPNLKTVLIKSMFLWMRSGENRCSALYHQMCIIKKPSQNISFWKKLQFFDAFSCLIVKLKSGWKTKLQKKKKKLAIIKNGGKKEKKKWEWEVWQIPLSGIGIFCQITPVGPRVWLSGMQPAVYSYLAFSLIEAIAKFDQALKSIR